MTPNDNKRKGNNGDMNRTTNLKVAYSNIAKSVKSIIETTRNK